MPTYSTRLIYAGRSQFKLKSKYDIDGTKVVFTVEPFSPQKNGPGEGTLSGSISDIETNADQIGVLKGRREYSTVVITCTRDESILSNVVFS